MQDHTLHNKGNKMDHLGKDNHTIFHNSNELLDVANAVLCEGTNTCFWIREFQVTQEAKDHAPSSEDLPEDFHGECVMSGLAFCGFETKLHTKTPVLDWCLTKASPCPKLEGFICCCLIDHGDDTTKGQSKHPNQQGHAKEIKEDTERQLKMMISLEARMPFGWERRAMPTPRQSRCDPIL